MKYLLALLFLASSSLAFSQIKYVTVDVDQTGINECYTLIENSFTNNEIKIYPNPNEGLFTVEIFSPPVDSEYSIKGIKTSPLVYYRGARECANAP
ncbi:hypothetical protein ES705_50064 [subsurface metagenome]